MGKLLKFLCSLPNMETHADLIAGTPTYHLCRNILKISVFWQHTVRKSQLSLKLLPGTEMRRRAEELASNILPLPPPYEVLQTREINVSELQTACQPSPACWMDFILQPGNPSPVNSFRKKKKFLYRFLEHLIQIGLIDQPISLEKRGLILYEFCKQQLSRISVRSQHCLDRGRHVTEKLPAEKVKTKRQVPPENWQVLYGQYKENLRLCFLPVNEETNQGYWFGFESRQKAGTRIQSNELTEKINGRQDHRKVDFSIENWKQIIMNVHLTNVTFSDKPIGKSYIRKMYIQRVQPFISKNQ